MRLRLATSDDALAIAEIYAPLVLDSAVSFELVPPDEAEMRRRILETLPQHPWLVAEDGGLLGYAYAKQFKARAAYQWSAESSVYVRTSARGRGVGRALYQALIARLRAQGFAAVIGGITLPNEASVRLHEALGFEPVARFPAVGYKQGRWHDVGYWQLRLTPLDRQPSELLPVTEDRAG